MPNKQRKVNTRVFKKETSVFKDWKEDTTLSLKKMIDNDIQCWKVPRFVKSLDDVYYFAFTFTDQ